MYIKSLMRKWKFIHVQKLQMQFVSCLLRICTYAEQLQVTDPVSYKTRYALCKIKALSTHCSIRGQQIPQNPTTDSVQTTVHLDFVNETHNPLLLPYKPFTLLARRARHHAKSPSTLLFLDQTQRLQARNNIRKLRAGKRMQSFISLTKSTVGLVQISNSGCRGAFRRCGGD